MAELVAELRQRSYGELLSEEIPHRQVCHGGRSTDVGRGKLAPRTPPIRVHVGDDEVLLDDSPRYVERVVAAGIDAKLDVWMGMPHGFLTNVGGFNAADQALSASGVFLTERMGRTGR